MINKEGLYQRSERYISSDLGEAMILSDINSDKFYGTNVVGLNIWGQMKSPTTFGAIVQSLLREFSVEQGLCQLEVETFMNELFKVGAIQEVG